MTYQEAQKILNFTSKSMSVERRAELAASVYETLTHSAPLKKRVACAILIEAAQEK